MLVDGVTKLDKVQYGDSAQAETIRKMIVAMARDIRVLVIKLADRLHNMRTVRYVKQSTQERQATESLDIYAPLAHRLGMNTIKWELEDLAFATLHPKIYDEIVRMVAERAPSRDQFLTQVIEQVEQDLKDAKVKATRDRAAQALLLDLPEDDRRRPRVQRHLRPGRRCGSWSRRTATATPRSASCTRGGTRCSAGSRTTSRRRSSTCTSRCTRP